MYRNGTMLQVNLPASQKLQNLMMPETDLPAAATAVATAPASKKKRKKTARDRAMKIAIKEANARYRKKNGQFRSGRSQADVMRLANKLADRMMK